MRCRVDEYTAAIVDSGETLQIEFEIDELIYNALPSDAAEVERKITEAIRLVTDETLGGYLICSTGQKQTIDTATKSIIPAETEEVSGETIVIEPEKYKVTVTFSKSELELTNVDDNDELAFATLFATIGDCTDQFTIAVDWGETLVGVYAMIGDLGDIIDAINGDTIDGILDRYTARYAEQIEEIVGDFDNE